MFAEIVTGLEQAHFLRPWWLLALLPAGLLLLALWRRRRRDGAWQQVIDAHLLPHLLDGDDQLRRRASWWGLLALWVLATVALAGPAWKQLPEPVQKGGSAVIVAWDMSPSMMAEDLTPSRLQRSRLKLVDLLRARREGTTGLVAYAGEAHVVTPLTDDAETIISLLPALTPANMPVAGSNPEMALEMAFQLLHDAGIPRGDVLLVTDEIVPEAFNRLQRIARGAEHQITIWGVGTVEGAPIPLPQGGFARDRAGNMVIPKLNEDQLQEFAGEINAYYVPLLQTDEDIETLQRLFDTQPAQLRETDRVFDNWYEHGPWLLLLVLPLAALAFRRGWLMGLGLVVLLPLGLPQQAHAFEWQDLWQTPDQQGKQALEQNQPEQAAELFQNPGWRGTALYRAGDYRAALDAFRTGENSARNLYNQGNALLQMGRYADAVDAFDRALERNPEHEDARHNRRLAQQLLDQQQQEAQNQSGKSDGDSQASGEQEGGAEEGQENSGQQDGDQGKGESGDAQQSNGGSSHEDQPYDNPDNNRPGDSAGQEPSAKGEEPSATGEEPSATGQEPSAEGEEPSADKEPSADGDSSAGDEPSADGRPSEEQSDQPGQTAVADDEMSEAEREQQQALEQWLRRIPDDPGGLIRNKFEHEHRERRLTRDWTIPDNNATQRW